MHAVIGASVSYKTSMDSLCKLVLELYRAARETPVEEFQELALSLVKTKIHFRSAMWGTYEMADDGIAVNSVHLHNEPLEILPDWASLHRRNPIVGKVTAYPGHAHIFHAFASYTDVPEMLDFARRYGHINVLAIAEAGRNFAGGRMQGEWVSVYRAGEHDRFAPDDQHNMEQLMPHLAEALAINRMLKQKPQLLELRRISPLDRLSGRELEVARLFGQGQSHKEIALRLEISPATVRNFLSNAYKKLGINNKAELAGLFNEGDS